ncbi:hypothetical protein [Catalinimonas niigatensis]|uniref:hypothetical protein n=1 Tax=Catalinimonas niigatensis TaxID=1397264 RepID=UPI0026656882|nr:hypothetical protein [Catalinimonas niigatensis]WPP52995.1 hypothetical protein PZB72_11475 [Catalinimonas niigatensis]
MKNHYIRSLILITIFVLGIFFPISDWMTYPVLLVGIVISFLTGLSTPFLFLLNLGMGSYDIHPPRWTDSITNMRKPLIFVQYVEYFTYAWGIGLMIGELNQNQSANLFGICLIMGGLGIKSGMLLLLKRDNA